MLRFVQRKLVRLIMILLVFASFQLYLPKIGKQIGEWISGTKDSRVERAVSKMLDSIGQGNDANDVIEVFCDELQES